MDALLDAKTQVLKYGGPAFTAGVYLYVEIGEGLAGCEVLLFRRGDEGVEKSGDVGPDICLFCL